MANTYIINAPVSNADGSITFSGSINAVPVSVTLNKSGIQPLLGLPNVAALQQAIIALFVVATTPPVAPVLPVLPVSLTLVGGTIVQ